MCAESKSPLSAALDRSAALPCGSEEKPPAATETTLPLPFSAPVIAALSPPSAVPVRTVNAPESSRQISAPNRRAAAGVRLEPTTANIRVFKSAVFPLA